ncbi:Cellulase [Thermaerobacter marianensis DSM 12885]|uniref:Cellulase n=1 Tax=Thermaerobacter marianensis (strain ATCC 700841 / DSM 12885 / JCM 10246 / 7p75a) TaxID=644966 RepID=E6SL40_THEM7|nr:M42 family metallopeptidase [Thermaerobacter marianensis]ADU50242.1 Cellulase [Thermaerobacter marianensis DSM 12885]
MATRSDTARLLEELAEAPGVPGAEDAVRQVMRRYLEPVAELEQDHLGSLIARRRGTADRPRILLAAHMDEVGFMVRRITDEGYLKFQPLGGWWGQVLLAQRVTVYTRRGPILGVIGSKPPHVLPPDERKKTVEIKDMFIDVGASGRQQAEEWGIRPGDPVVPYGPFTRLHNPDLVLAKALDDRAGCAVIVRVLEELAGTEHPNTVYGVATVHEEVARTGGGARTSAFAVDPDVAVAVDVGIAGDVPGVQPDEAQSRLGRGPTVLLFDSSMVPHRRLRDLVADTAEAEGIPYQFDMMPGGATDAGFFHVHGRGVPSVVVGPPARYVHSHGAIVHLDDVENTVRLLVALVRRLDAATVDALRRGG